MACSHGQLIEGKCVCFEGWSSIGDFSPIAGIDCDINILAIKIIGFTSFVIGFLSFACYVYFLYQRMTANTVYGKKDYFAAVYVLCFLCVQVMALLSALDERAVVGISPAKTLVVSIGYLTALCGALLFFEVVLELLVGIVKVLSIEAQARVKESNQAFNSRAKALYTIHLLNACVPLAGLGAPVELYMIIGRVYYLCLGILLGIFLMLFNPPVSLLRKELALTIRNQLDNIIPGEENPLTNSFKDIRTNITIVQYCVNTIFGTGAAMFIINGSWDYILRKSSYLILYCCIVINITSLPMLVALSYKKKTDTKKTPSFKNSKISPINAKPPVASSSLAVVQGDIMTSSSSLPTVGPNLGDI